MIILVIIGLITLITLILLGSYYACFWHCKAPNCIPINLDVYVDSSAPLCGGNGTQCCPLQNLRQALTKVFETGWQERATIHLMGAKDYDIISDTRILNTKSLRGDQMHQLVIAGDDTTLVKNDLIMTAITNGPANLAKLTISQKVTNAQVQGGVLRFVSTGKRHVIGYVDEATNDVYLTETSSNVTAQPGDHFSIGFPSASFKFADGGVLFSSPSTVLFRNLNFKLRDLNGGIDNLTVFGPGLYGFSGIVFKPVSSTVAFAGAAFLNCTAIFGTSLIAFPGIRDNEATGCSFLGSKDALNLFVVAVGSKPLQIDNAAFRNAMLQTQAATANLQSAIMHVSAAFVQQTTSLLTLNNVWSLDSFSTAFTVLEESTISVQDSEISGAAGDGISLDTSHLCNLSNVTTDPANKNANLGLYIGPISNAKIQTSSVTLTGLTNDVQVGVRPPQTWADPIHSDLAEPNPIFAMYASY